jgi:hypothetical protein
MKLQIALITKLFSCLSQLTIAQWQISTGTVGINMQSLLLKGAYDFQAVQQGQFCQLIPQQPMPFQMPLIL